MIFDAREMTYAETLKICDEIEQLLDAKERPTITEARVLLATIRHLARHCDAYLEALMNVEAATRAGLRSHPKNSGANE